MSGIRENLESVRERMRKACERAGRSESEVVLVAVSKTKPVEMLQEAYDLGVRDFGENRVQEMLMKSEALPKDIRWHLIGHLQTNKVKQALKTAYMIHSVDSLKLAEEISKEAVKSGKTARILLEVNIAGEASKFGTKPEETPFLAEKIAALPGISPEGLMCVPPYVDVAEKNRPYFCDLHNILVDIRNKNVDNRQGISENRFRFLSMGMSGDFEVAIEAGADFIRVGSSIFGERG